MEQWMLTHLPALILAIAGGISDFLMTDDERHSFSNMLVVVFLSGFCGCLVILACLEFKVTPGWTGIAAGFAGLSSRPLLHLAKRISVWRLLWYFEAPHDLHRKKDDDERDD